MYMVAGQVQMSHSVVKPRFGCQHMSCRASAIVTLSCYATNRMSMYIVEGQVQLPHSVVKPRVGCRCISMLVVDVVPCHAMDGVELVVSFDMIN